MSSLQAKAKATGTLSVRPPPVKVSPAMVPCIYKDQTAVMFATGPSLTEEEVEKVRPYHEAGKVRAFGCNDAYKLVDFLDVHYACDGPWWRIHNKDCLSNLRPDCHVWTQDKKTAADLGINLIGGSHKAGFCLDTPNFIHFGSNSGYQILNLAYHYGIRKFILVGYNMSIQNNKKHFFGDHPQGLSNGSPYKKFIENYGTIQPEIKDMIFNATPLSALSCFKLVDLAKMLESL